MDEVRLPVKFFLVGFVLSLMRYLYLTIPAFVLIVLGIFGVPWCLSVGAALLLLALGVAVIGQIRIAHAIGSSTDAEFRSSLNEILQNDGTAFKARLDSRIRYPKMTHEELLALDEEELVGAIVQRIDARYVSPIYGATYDNLLSPVERIVQTVYLFDLEFQNGGLFQYFVSSSRWSAPFLEESLRAIGADATATVYQAFLSEHGIDPNDLEWFRFEEVDTQLRRTVAEERPIRRLVDFVRLHIEEL